MRAFLVVLALPGLWGWSNAQSKNSPGTHATLEYAGDDACRGCHSSIYESFKKTGMGRSTSIPSSDDLQEASKPIQITRKDRSYKVYVQDGKIIHQETGTDSAGLTTFSENHPIAYTVGTGDIGKSYLISEGDALFVSPISYYTRINGFDLSPGYDQGVFRDFTRRVTDLCVDCHTGFPRTIPGSHDRFQQPPFRYLTVGCERCHGPGAGHVAQRTIESYPGEAADTSIVNPRKVSSDVRDDICMQCHQAGDARVLQPGKDYLDFRPGKPLGDVVAIYSVPQTIKGNHFVLLDQFEEMKLSRCWRASDGKLGCISCHDPHVQLHEDEAATFFRSRCLTCHTNSSCTAPRASRQATSPPDNCIGCHMPKHTSERIAHTSQTDHRILKTQSEIPTVPQETDLIEDAKPSNTSIEQNLRNLALAYAQAGLKYSEFDEKALHSLELAAATMPGDAEVQATYGRVLLLGRPGEHELAGKALQKAIDDGSTSAEVRIMLARVRMREGHVDLAIELYKAAIQLDPYSTAAYLDLAKVYSTQGDRQQALQMLDDVLKIDPGNDAARAERLEISRNQQK